MKFIVTASMRLILLSLTIAVAGALPAYGQEARLNIAHLDRFTDKAAEVINVDVPENLLKLAATFLKSERSPDEAKAKELIQNLKGVYVKRFQFENEGEYLPSDVETVRAQINAPGWTKIADVRSKKKASFDVVIMTDGNLIKGLAVLAVEPKAITVVNIVGPIDLENLSQLEGKFGIPRFGLETGAPREEEKR